MNIQKLLFVSLCLIPCPQIHADALGDALYDLLLYGLDYPRRLEMRRNMPESKEEYFKRIEAGLKHLDKHLEKTIKDDYDWHITGPMMHDLRWEIGARWKKGWWDHNPGWGDLILTSSIVSVLGIIITACRSSVEDTILENSRNPIGSVGNNGAEAPQLPPADVPGEA